MIDAAKIKERASESFAKGKFSKAGELYSQYCAANPKDLQSRLRMGDAWAKAGEVPRAIDAYRTAAESFAKAGFLPRAIAASKLILDLDPSHQGVQKMLADLYAARGFGGARRAPKAPSPVQPPAAPPPAAIVNPEVDESAPILLGNEVEVASAPAPSPPARTAVAPEPIAPKPVSPSALELEIEVASSGDEDSESSSAPEVIASPATPEVVASPPTQHAEATDLLEPARRTGSKPPLPPEQPVRIISAHDYQAPPGLGRKRTAEVPSTSRATEAHPPAPHSTAEWTGGSELQASFAAFSKFDELDLGPEDPAPPAAARATETFTEMPPAEPTPSPAEGPADAAGGFTELELSGDSLLHAVELAAAAALAEAGESLEPESESEPLEVDPTPRELPDIPLFSDLPPEAFIALFERCPLRRFDLGARVIQQGTVGNAFFVICEGSVRVSREEAGEEKQLATLAEGAFFGEMALLSGAPRSASVDAATEDTQLLEIAAPVLEDLSRSHPEIATALRKFCRQRMLANIMERSDLFRALDGSERRAIVAQFCAREVERGNPVILEGQQTDGLYVVLSGDLEVRKQDQVVGRLGEGDVFGEMSLLAKSPATASVRALRRTSLLCLPRDHFDALIRSHPRVHELVSGLTADRRRQNVAAMRRALAEEAPLMV